MSPAYDNSEHSGVLVFIVPPVDLELNGFQNLYGRLTWLKRALNNERLLLPPAIGQFCCIPEIASMPVSTKYAN